jgi:hypothetical protein
MRQPPTSIRARLVLPLLGALCVLALLFPTGAAASRNLQIGIMDDAQVRDHRDPAFAELGSLRPEVLRVTLWWKELAPTMPANPRDPASYNWALYDDVVIRAREKNISVMFTILGTPSWANGGRARNVAPTRPGISLRDFSYAAAKHFSGLYVRGDGKLIPKVTRWTAWNEPNLPFWLKPRSFRRGQHLRALALAYARICNGVMVGVHQAGRERGIAERVACGVTAPQKKGRLSYAPITFLRAIKAARAKFDVYAHHPHPRSRTQSPTTRPRGSGTIVLGNISVLVKELTRLYGRKKLWLTEFGYQTNPPDRQMGVSRRTQARWMKTAFTIARRNPRIDMLVWFLFRDEPDLNGSRFGAPGWQSGLISVSGTRKPSFTTFRRLPR